jgi:hypothetical protein
VLVHPDDRTHFHEYMRSQKCEMIAHPEGKEAGYVFLYSMYPIECWNLSGLERWTVFYQLGCHGLLEKSYIPLDKQINKFVWERRFLKEDVYYMGEREQLIHYLVLGIFHYKTFPTELMEHIQRNEIFFDKKDFLDELSKVFFGFTETLRNMIHLQQYDKIAKAYVTFSDY